MTNLLEYGIKLRHTQPGDYKALCPECSHKRKSRNKKDPCLSVTLEPDGGAVWKCHNCEWSGGIPGDRHRDYQRREREYKRPEPPKERPKPDKMVQWFEGRKISKKTVEAFGVYRTEKGFRDEDGNWKNEPCIAFPYEADTELVNIKYRTADKRFAQEPKAERTLFNIDSVKTLWDQEKEIPIDDRPLKTVIWAEGEMDVMALWEAGFKNATSLPDGAPKEAKFDPEDKRFQAIGAHPWLDEAEKVIIAVDADGPGAALAQELVHRFGRDRCWKVNWPTLNDVSIKDANECLIEHGEMVLQECVMLAEALPIEGVYRADDYRADVLDIYHGRVQQPVSTGFTRLDQIYRVLPGTFHVVTGIPNHGKSSFIDQIAVNLAKLEHWKFAVFSPEHSVGMHLRRLVEKVRQAPFDEGYSQRMTETELLQGLEFIHEHFMFVESKDTSPNIDWILEKARAACLRYGIRGVIIDPYNEIDPNRKPGEREDEHVRNLISKCKAFNRRHNTVMWMIAHPTKMPKDNDGKVLPPTMYDISGAAHWHNMADVGLAVHRYFDDQQTAIFTRKIREQPLYGDIGERRFRFNVVNRIFEEVAVSDEENRRELPEYLR